MIKIGKHVLIEFEKEWLIRTSVLSMGGALA